MPRSSRPADQERLTHMLRAAQDAVAIATGRRREELDTDILLPHALIHCVQVIGEAAARVTDAGRAHVTGLPWPRMVGMRHILVHDYFNVDLDAVWRVVNEHIPGMIPVLQAALTCWPAEDAP